ncbi:MAG: preprotein translocase subunit SecE [Chlorobi bacterium]|nr:preprotein translocase subunit SecE [Chlorobiota bacterium]
MKFKSFFSEAYNELMHKVTWPTWSELQNSAVIVMVATILIAMVIFLMDFSFQHIMDFVYKLFF